MEELNFEPTEVIFNASMLRIILCNNLWSEISTFAVTEVEERIYCDNFSIHAYDDKCGEVKLRFSPDYEPATIRMEIVGKYLKFTTDSPDIAILFTSENEIVNTMNYVMPAEYSYEAYGRQPLEPLKLIDNTNLSVAKFEDLRTHIDLTGMNNLNKDHIEVYYLVSGNEYDDVLNPLIIKGELYNDSTYAVKGTSIINTKPMTGYLTDVVDSYIVKVMIMNNCDNGHGKFYTVSKAFIVNLG